MASSRKSKRQVPGKASGGSLSRERILSAALELADEFGTEQLSMRRLARALGVEAMSLYHHVANKEEVLDGILDRVVGEFDVPVVGDYWKRAMRERATSTYKVLLRHPWAALSMLSRVNVGPSILVWSNATVGCLREAGFEFPLIDHATNAIDNHVYGFALHVLNTPISPDEYASAARHYLPLVAEDSYPYLHAMVQQIIDGTHSGINDFEFGLDLVLDGLERLKALAEE